MASAEVSVVMGVYNGVKALPQTLASILDQERCDFEFIVIDDGSTDGSGALLDEWAQRDERLRVIHQENMGLTRALIHGCAQARGEFIARQDCGDVSLPGRLHHQLQLLRAHPGAVMVGSGARFVGPKGEPLMTVVRRGRELHDGLGRLNLATIAGPPHHGATMFRRDAYEEAGGYRPFFKVAQDIDLWLRLREQGPCLGDDEVVYEARMEEGSISARRRAMQLDMAQIAIDCTRERAKGHDDGALLVERALPPPTPSAAAGLERARFLYFIGSCLRESDPRSARRYFWAAWRSWPLMIKSLLRVALP